MKAGAKSENIMNQSEGIMKQYNVDGRIWTMQDNSEAYQLWISNSWYVDGDIVELYIANDESGFELCCFVGVPTSKICIYGIDFFILWQKAFSKLPEVGQIQNYTHVQQCIMLADWLCGIFCK
jgi:hypothetical protein